MTRSIKVVLWFLSLALSASARKAFRDGVRVASHCPDSAQGLCYKGGKWVADKDMVADSTPTDMYAFKLEPKDQCKIRTGLKRCTKGDRCELVTEDKFGVLTPGSECLDAQIENKGIDAASECPNGTPCCAPEDGGSVCVRMERLPTIFANIKKDKEDKLAAEIEAANLAIRQKTDICCRVKDDRDGVTTTYEVRKFADEKGNPLCGNSMGRSEVSGDPRAGKHEGNIWETRVSMRECRGEGAVDDSEGGFIAESCMGTFLGESLQLDRYSRSTKCDAETGPGCKTGYIERERGLLYQCGDASAAVAAVFAGAAGYHDPYASCVLRECVTSPPDE